MSPTPEPNNPPYRDAELNIEERVADLLQRMTIEEKAGQLIQLFHFDPAILEAMGAENIPPALLEQTARFDQDLRRGAIGSLLFVSSPARTNQLQRIAAESRHGIPLLFGFDVIHGLRTIFPVPIALAASWDPDTAEHAQTVAAREARSVGIHWAFAPMIDIARDGRWGRIVEGSGEDPYLGAVIAAAQVRGFQGGPGRARSESIIAGPKHFAGYGAAIGGRDYEEANISDADLWNVYLPPFQAAIDAGAGNIMAAYMDLNGIPAAANTWLLTDVLRRQLGFDGFVVTDAKAVHNTVTQHFAVDPVDASVRTLAAGTDMEMAFADPAFSRLPSAVADGLVDEARLDQAVKRILRAKFRLGLFENPYVDEKVATATLHAASHREQARIAAERSFVLLKNDGILPLNPDAVQRIAIIGDLADSRRDTLGPWIFDPDEDETVTVLAGVRGRASAEVSIEYARGLRTAERVFSSPFENAAGPIPTTPEDFDDDAEFAAAVKTAARSDVAIVVVGQPQNMIGEAASASSLDLPGRQLELLQAVAETGTPLIVLVMSGRPLDLRWADQNSSAILEIWYPGSQGGTAVAATLFGDVSPAGRLPFTWPRSVGQLPQHYAHLTSFQPENQNTRYWNEESTPLYPFGHGLSYATFEYGSPIFDRTTIPVGDTVTVRVDVINTSDRTADDVAQLYIHQRHGTASRPVRELKGFQRITVAAHSTHTIEFTLGPHELRYWNAASRKWVQDTTTLDIWVGGSLNAAHMGQVEVSS